MGGSPACEGTTKSAAPSEATKMKKCKEFSSFWIMEDEAPRIEREEDDVLTQAELNRLAFLAEHPEFADSLFGLLSEKYLSLTEQNRMHRRLMAEIRATRGGSKVNRTKTGITQWIKTVSGGQSGSTLSIPLSAAGKSMAMKELRIFAGSGLNG